MNCPGVNCPGVNCPGVNCPGVNRPGVNCPGVNCPGVNCPGVNRPGVNCPGVNCPGVNCPDTGSRGPKVACAGSYLNPLKFSVSGIYPSDCRFQASVQYNIIERAFTRSKYKQMREQSIILK